MKNSEYVKVVEVKGDSLLFSDGTKLYSNHETDCCESHYLDLSHLSLEDFEGLEFDLSNDSFFNRIEDYGIELVPVRGFSVKIPGYGFNNGYYSNQLTLILEFTYKESSTYDISECQDIT